MCVCACFVAHCVPSFRVGVEVRMYTGLQQTPHLTKNLAQRHGWIPVEVWKVTSTYTYVQWNLPIVGTLGTAEKAVMHVHTYV